MEAVHPTEALRQTQLFNALSQEHLETIARRAKMRQYFPGETIVWQGQPSTALFLIINGIVMVKSLVRGRENILAYLMPGNTFGEVGILENQSRSASIVTLSEVDVLVIQRDEFLDILHRHPTVGVELARILGRYLVSANRRLSNESTDTRLILLLSTNPEAHAADFGALLASRMYMAHQKPTALLEYPNPWRILDGHALDKGSQTLRHPDGFDILFPQEDPWLPFSTRTTLLLDKLRDQYDQVIIHLLGLSEEVLPMLLEHADQVILFSDPSPAGVREVDYMLRVLKGRIRQEETSLVSIANFHAAPPDAQPDRDVFDLEIPLTSGFPLLHFPVQPTGALSKPLETVLQSCLDRLERTSSIGIFIPTTTEANQKTDTSAYTDRAMAFMAERFGGATCKIANGVWNSDKLGLIGEVVYIVHSYITQSDLHRHLDEVVDFVKGLKRELRQEAMALEVNHKLTLI